MPVLDVPFGERKHELAEQELAARRTKEPDFTGVFCVLVARAPAKLWKVSHHPNGQPHLEVMKPWPMVYHLHFHVLESYLARGNAFVSGDFAALEKLAARPRTGAELERQLRALCARWVNRAA